MKTNGKNVGREKHNRAPAKQSPSGTTPKAQEKPARPKHEESQTLMSRKALRAKLDAVALNLPPRREVEVAIFEFDENRSNECVFCEYLYLPDKDVIALGNDLSEVIRKRLALSGGGVSVGGERRRAAQLANKCRIGQDKGYSTIDRNETQSGRPVSYFVALGAELGDLDESQLTSVLLPFLPLMRNIVATQNSAIESCEPGDVVSMETVPETQDSPDASESELLSTIRQLGPEYLAEKLREAKWARHHLQQGRIPLLAKPKPGASKRTAPTDDTDTDTVEAPSAELAVAQ